MLNKTQTLQDNGRTTLFYAVANGMLDLAQKLLEHGADLNIADGVCHVNTFFWHKKLEFNTYRLESLP